MRSVPLPFLSKITLLWTRAREPGPVSPVKVDSPLPFPWTQRGEIYTAELLNEWNVTVSAEFPSQKDWNDALLTIRQEEAQGLTMSM